MEPPRDLLVPSTETSRHVSKVVRARSALVSGEIDSEINPTVSGVLQKESHVGQIVIYLSVHLSIYIYTDISFIDSSPSPAAARGCAGSVYSTESTQETCAQVDHADYTGGSYPEICFDDYY